MPNRLRQCVAFLVVLAFLAVVPSTAAAEPDRRKAQSIRSPTAWLDSIAELLGDLAVLWAGDDFGPEIDPLGISPAPPISGLDGATPALGSSDEYGQGMNPIG